MKPIRKAAVPRLVLLLPQPQIITSSPSLQIFSKVNNTLRVELCNMTVSPPVIINEQLVLEGFAAKCEEPYLSKVSLWPHDAVVLSVCVCVWCFVLPVFPCR